MKQASQCTSRGVPTASYFPYCFFNLASPVLDVVYGFLGFKTPQRQTDV